MYHLLNSYCPFFLWITRLNFFASEVQGMRLKQVTYTFEQFQRLMT